MNLFQLLFIPLCVLLAISALYRTTRGQLSRRQGLVWGIIWAASAVLISMPRVTSIAASWLGIGRGTDLVFYCAILFGLLACLYFYRRYRALEIIVTELVRLSAIDHAKHGPGHQETAEPGEMSRE